jgi:hypothetical protein
MDIDLLFLSRDASPPREDVWRGIEAQQGVRLRVHRVIGTPQVDDPNRWATIARARNQGKQLGTSPLVMYLDDDVVLGLDCVARLVEGLKQRPGFAALAADSAEEMSPGWENWDYPAHVGMAAVLFRRERLAELTFRWEPGKCECRCCCDDLRRAGFGIGYLPGAVAWHRPSGPSGASHPVEQEGAKRPCRRGVVEVTRRAGRVLAAFNRRDFRRFCRRFLATLRGSGNWEPVTAVAYGLMPSEQALLAAEPGVEVIALAEDGVCPALRRLRDFQDVIARWPDETPVAYWDAGDIQFQGRLESLWDLVRAHPDRLLAAAEALHYPENKVIQAWANYIRDPQARRRAFELMSTHRFLNSGFAAGTVPALLNYLREGDRLLHSADLLGVGDWGDQPAMNLYCHTNPDAWREVSPTWNFTLAGRDPGRYRVGRDGRYESSRGEPIQVVHGNAGMLIGSELALMV